MMRLENVRWIVVAMPLLFITRCDFAQAATTQPEGRSSPLFRNLSPEEQNQVRLWVNVHMQNLAKLIANTPDNKGIIRRNRLLNAATVRYHNYLASRDQAEYESQAKSIRLEDEIFGDIDQLDAANPEQRAKLFQEIRDKTHSMVSLFLSDRAERIDRLRARLDAEQRSLDADRSRIDSLIEQRLQHFYVVDMPTTAPSKNSDSSSNDPAQ